MHCYIPDTWIHHLNNVIMCANEFYENKSSLLFFDMFFYKDLAGKTDLDQARADMLIDCYEDTLKPAFPFFFEKDADKKVCMLEDEMCIALNP